MDLPVIIGLIAFIVLAVMLVMLWASGRHDDATDIVTQEIIVKANTGPVTIAAPITQESED